MAKIIETETEKAWEELVGKPKKEEKEEKEEEKEESEKEEGKGEEQEKAAAWLTGGLEDEISGGKMTAPVLQMNLTPVESLEDFASSIPKKEEKKEGKPYETRMYETKGAYENEDEIYKESAENLFGRMVRPLDTNELRQDIPRVRIPAPTELRGPGMEEDMRKYVERKQDSSELPFMRQEKRLEVKKYKKW
jgi:hypothetical protein